MSDELNEVASGEAIDNETGAVITAGGGNEPGTSATPEAAPAELNGYEKRIATLTSRAKHQEQEIARLRADAAKAQPAIADTPPEIPDMPDPELRYDEPEKYRQLIAARDKAIIENAQWHTRKAIREERDIDARTSREREQQTHVSGIVDKFVENGLKSGISEVRMGANEQILMGAKTHQDVFLHIYSDEAGAQIADYLAQNPEDLRTLNSLTPMQAAVKIATEIKPRALANKPHVTNAPDPATPTRGGSKPLGNEWDDVAKGATFK